MTNIKIKTLNKQVLFAAGYQNSHSYRIPSLLKLKSGKLISIVDQRLENAMDCPYATINQFAKYSNDNGATWSEGKVIIKLEKFANSLVSITDSVIVQNQVNGEIILLVDAFPGGSGIIRPAKNMNAIVASGLGYTPDGKYRRFHQYGSDIKMILMPLASHQDWYQVYQLINDDWKHTQVDNLKALPILIDNSYDPKTTILHGAVYENETDPSKISSQPVCSIFDGFDNREKNYSKPKYYLDSTAYIYGFKSKDDGLTWKLIGELNNQVAQNFNIFALVMGPGKGLQLQHQKNKNLNGRLIMPVYTMSDYEIPAHFYTTYSDDSGKTWKTGNYVNPLHSNQWRWASETQIIEDHKGQVWSFSRIAQKNSYCLAKSLDGTQTWVSPDDSQTALTCYAHPALNAEIMHGVAYFQHQQKGFVLLSLPATAERKNGQLLIMDLEEPSKLMVIHDITNSAQTFGYSTIEILQQSEQKITIGVLYEVSVQREQTLAWIGFDETESDYSLATEMIYETIELSL